MQAEHLQYFYNFDNRGRTDTTPELSEFVKDLVELTLLTNPGERVNRPDFGSGLPSYVFEPNSETLATSVEFLIKSNLQRWLQHLVLIEALSVRGQDSSLIVDLTYSVLATGERIEQQMTRNL